MSSISVISTTTLTDQNEKCNDGDDDNIHDEIDDIYKQVFNMMVLLNFHITL